MEAEWFAGRLRELREERGLTQRQLADRAGVSLRAIAQWEQVARIRSLEPTGLLKLAAAQIHELQWDQAAETLRKLDTRTWPARFGDVCSPGSHDRAMD